MLDLLMEIVIEIYLELMFLIVPEKNVTKKQRLAAKLLAVAVLIGLIALVIWGCVLLEENNRWGIVPIAVAAVLSLAQIIAGIVLYSKNHPA